MWSARPKSDPSLVLPRLLDSSDSLSSIVYRPFTEQEAELDKARYSKDWTAAQNVLRKMSRSSADPVPEYRVKGARSVAACSPRL